MPDPLVQLNAVSMRYAADEPAVLDHVDLTVAPGESLAIVGPSGCGKSTLLNIIGALDRPTDGSVIFDGKPLAGMSDDQLAELRNQRIGFVFQDHHLLPQCTVLENVLVPTIPHGKSKQVADRARMLLQRVGLGDKLDSRPGQLSGGQRQRVAVVRAMINQPALLLADEPTGSLDHTSSDSIADLLAQLNRDDRLTLIVVTHSDALAQRMGRVMALNEGKLGEVSS